MFRDNTFQNANNKGADQSARMRRLVCTFVVRKPPKTGFLASRPILTQFPVICYMLILVQSFTLFVGNIALMANVRYVKIECRLCLYDKVVSCNAP